MSAWMHPDWTALVRAWLAAAPGTEERRLACLAMADASEEMGDTWYAYMWREVIAGPPRPAPATGE